MFLTTYFTHFLHLLCTKQFDVLKRYICTLCRNGHFELKTKRCAIHQLQRWEDYIVDYDLYYIWQGDLPFNQNINGHLLVDFYFFVYTFHKPVHKFV